MRVIAALSEPVVVAKVLSHLDLPTALLRPGNHDQHLEMLGYLRNYELARFVER